MDKILEDLENPERKILLIKRRKSEAKNSVIEQLRLGVRAAGTECGGGFTTLRYRALAPPITETHPPDNRLPKFQKEVIP